jgi:hypothetical protein
MFKLLGGPRLGMMIIYGLQFLFKLTFFCLHHHAHHLMGQGGRWAISRRRRFGFKFSPQNVILLRKCPRDLQVQECRTSALSIYPVFAVHTGDHPFHSSSLLA